MLDLTSARAKLAWAEQHARTIYDELKAWFDQDPYSTEAEPNDDFTEWVFRLRMSGADDQFRRIALLVGDCLNGLRCALDHAMYAVVIHEQCGQRPLANLNRLNFPITDSPTLYTKRLKNIGVYRLISAAARDLIESAQPYNRPLQTDPERGALTLLRDLNNIDKHHLLHVVYAERGKFELPFNNPDGATFTFSDPPYTLEDGAELTVASSDIPAPNVKFDGKMAVGIAIEYRGLPFYLPTAITDVIMPEVRRVLDLIETLS